jgi:shikimate dehydrogenase
LAGAGQVTVVNRTESRGRELVDLLSGSVGANARFEPLGSSYAIPQDVEIFIQATSVGLGDGEARLPIDWSTLRRELVVADVVFNPPETRLLREAKLRGCKTLDGLGMLVNQALIAFKIWTGIDADAGTMREALEEFLGF